MIPAMVQWQLRSQFLLELEQRKSHGFVFSVYME